MFVDDQITSDQLGLGKRRWNRATSSEFAEFCLGTVICMTGFKGKLFFQVMMRLFRLSSVEATFKCFNSSELFNKLEPKIKDAIYIYSKLSDLCQDSGNTYKSFLELKSKYKLDNRFKYWRIHEFPNYNVTNWEESLSFLEEQDVIVREVEKDRIYLKKYYEAEKNIAKGLNGLIEDHKSSGFTIDIDENRFVHLMYVTKFETSSPRVQGCFVNLISPFLRLKYYPCLLEKTMVWFKITSTLKFPNFFYFLAFNKQSKPFSSNSSHP